ncbi:MAG: TIR domain-containing protein [Rhodocyclales bacterium]|nr:TIR domain-containing protein [Rhodocyclales bacterium]
MWQYYGKVLTEESAATLFANVEGHDPRYGVPGGKYYAFGLFEGEAIGLFLRMARRAGNLFSEDEIQDIRAKVLDDLTIDDESIGKPVFVLNGNPAALWLDFVLYHASISHPRRFHKTVVNLDPFVESLRTIEHLLENPTIGRSDEPFSKIEKIKFKAALSFPGEKREYVGEVARELREKLGNDAIFYDLDYQAELARPNLDLLLQNIYRNNSELIIVFLCKEYDEKEWCGLEWRAIRDVIKSNCDSRVMLMRFDDADVRGTFSIDGFIDLRHIAPNQAADYILSRLQTD